MNIIDEIAEAIHYFLYHNLEPNLVIIPTYRRNEIQNIFMNGLVIGLRASQDGKRFVYECEVMYSYDTDKIKVAYTP